MRKVQNFAGWLALTALTVSSHAATAQTPPDQDLMNRLERLERDNQMLQQEVYRGQNPSEDAMPAPAILPSASPAQAQAYVGQLEEQLRIMNGRLEEIEYKIRSLESKFKAIEKDTDLRLGTLERRVNETPPPLDAQSPAAGGDAATYTPDTDSVPAPPGPTTGSPQNLDQPAVADDPRSVYNHAFKLLNQAKFADAGKAFEDFTSRYPKDPLVGNAYYWMGETYYVRRDFLKAADSFRIGYQSMPEGPKAPDNLLKLGMALSNLGKTQEACVVYSQMLAKFPDASASLKQKTEQERGSLGCK